MLHEMYRRRGHEPAFETPLSAESPETTNSAPSDTDTPIWRPKAEEIVEWPEPLRLAEHYIRQRAMDPHGRLTLRRYREEWWRYVCGAGYRQHSEEEQDATHYQHLDQVWTPRREKDGSPTGEYEKLVPRSGIVRELRLALPSRDLIVTGAMPRWLDGRPSPKPYDVVAFANGLLDTAAYCRDEATQLIASTPDWFSAVACPYDYDPLAACPAWIQFLEEAFEGDRQRHDLLQEWMGYLLVPDNRLEAFMMLVGKPRAGKGTTIDAITAMLGDDQVAVTNFTKMASRFGLHPLLGKLAAVLPDAHLSKSTDAKAALEVLKSISGNDEQSVDRKGIDELPKVKMALRFTIAVNELPQLPDSAGALKPRLKLLYYGVSFAGREDRTLKARIRAEAPGIAMWALKGLHRLREMGSFTEPEACKKMLEEFERLVSPVKSFVAECCELDPESYIEKSKLYARWSKWCQERGDQPGNNVQFGQQLFSAYSELSERRRGPRGQQFTTYEGVRICE